MFLLRYPVNFDLVRCFINMPNNSLVSAEATLNSRPLGPVESTSDDGIEPLIPGHFLVGGPLYALPSLPDVLKDHFIQEVEPHTKTHIRTLEGNGEQIT